MKSSFNNIAVIGTGVIGSGWIIRFLYNKKNGDLKAQGNLKIIIKNKK